MQQPCVPSITTIPGHLLEQAIFTLLDCPSLVVCNCVCIFFRNHSAPLLAAARKREISNKWYHWGISKIVSKFPELSLIIWFESALKYPLFKSEYLAKAALVGNLHVLQHAHKQLGHEKLDELIEPDVGHYAALGGHLKILEWLHKIGYTLDAEICSFAARGGHRHIIEWARNLRCPLEMHTSCAAAYGNHFELLRWLYEHQSCEIDFWTLIYAKETGNKEMVQWIIDQGIEDCNGPVCGTAFLGPGWVLSQHF